MYLFILSIHKVYFLRLVSTAQEKVLLETIYFILFFTRPTEQMNIIKNIFWWTFEEYGQKKLFWMDLILIKINLTSFFTNYAQFKGAHHKC